MERKRVQRKDREGEDLKHSFVKRQIEWRSELLIVCLLGAFAFFVNRHMEIKGLYMDDLYQWYSYNSESFLQAIFTFGGSRCRFLYNLVAWIEMAIFGPHVGWYVPFNILLNTGLAYTLYRMAHSFSRSRYLGILFALIFLMSRMSYYQIGQALGLMETMALWLAISILYLLYQILHEHDGKGERRMFLASGLYFAVCFVHERYMVLLPLFFLVLLFRKEKDVRQWIAPAVSFAVVQLIRFFVIGTVAPAGTGGTDVADTMSVSSVIKFALSQIAYLFGINAGPEHLNGQNFREAPLWVLMMIAIADLMLIVMVVALFIRLIQKKAKRVERIQTVVLFVMFIGACIACSSVTIRVEMRWVYVSYATALLFMAWIYGVLTEGMAEKGIWLQAFPYLSVLTVYVVLMLPVENYYRGLYPNLYYWADQERYNSLAEETYGNYGVGIFGKNIFVVGKNFEMEDFTAENFFRVFDPLKREESTRVVHVSDVRQFGLVDDNMLVIQEDPEHNRFQDVTHVVKTFKCRPIYGFYDDGWIDEKSKVQVMAGKTGKIHLSFTYPRDLTDDQWLTVYVNDEPVDYLHFTETSVETEIEAEPYDVVTLRFETNFFVPNAMEQRGTTKLALLLKMTAE